MDPLHSIATKISPDEIPCEAFYDPRTNMYAIKAVFPAAFIEPLLEKNSLFSIDVLSSKLRVLKDNFIAKLFSE
jgi:hypothetical protein